MQNINIAIDGPSGAGKSTISRILAQRLGYIYIDTGAMYRAVGLHVLNLGRDTKNAAEVIELLPEITVEIQSPDKSASNSDIQQVYLNGENVTEQIRTPEASIAAADVSAIPQVRAKLLSLQRGTAERNNVVMDGRDIGAEILPNAQVKIFLTADVEARAQRRFDELMQRGTVTTFDEVLADMQLRDKQDSTRETSPLRKAADAITVDTTELNFDESVEHLHQIITKRLVGRDALGTPQNKFDTPQTNKTCGAPGASRPTPPRPTAFFRFAKAILFTAFKILYRFKVYGKENIPRNEPFIACSNHNSYCDPVLLGMSLPNNFGAMAKEELFKMPILRFLIPKLGAFPVKRGRQDVAAIRTALQVLESGRYFIMFPEGARVERGKSVKGKNGAAMIASRAKVKILPIGIKGTYFPFRKMRVYIGKPLDLAQYGEKPDYNKITEELMNEINRLKGTNHK